MKTSIKLAIIAVLLACVSSFSLKRRLMGTNIQVCSESDRCKNNYCAEYLSRGCICYNDGTCTSADVNFCQNCQDPNVYGIILGSKCPTSHEVGSIARCKASGSCKC